MPLLALPNELLLQIARCLLHSPACECGRDCRCDCHCHWDCDCHCECDCHYHHISPDVSSLSRVNQHLHGLLKEYLLATASTLHILFWAVANSRPDTVALALERGADPNCPLRPNSHVTTSWHPYTTPVDLAISMRVHSVDAPSHAVKLHTLTLLLAAGGTCTVEELIKPARCGDLDLLTLCLPYLPDTEVTYSQSGPRTLLEIASRRGHVEAAKLVIAAGAPVNSTGVHNDPRYYPALWVCWQAPIAVLQVLLDAGADPTWRARHGDSVVQNMRGRAVGTAELEEKVALLVRWGAVDEGECWRLVREGGKRKREPPEKEYRGWAPGSREVPVDWAREWLMMGTEEGCRCPRGELKDPGMAE
ncbi:hypothetical protein Q9L58_005613 [Maublancomyces gigas]|uniref:Ankyrin n=1 Tax=Discina gigas TaxID=1032678 RepID=A0ABR3GHL4_9PEZI